MLDSTAAIGALHRIRALRAWPLVPAALLASVAAIAPALAQVYKWVDDSGVTHYSDQAPANRKFSTKLNGVSDRLSLYTPAPYLVQAAYSGSDPTLKNRIDALERQLQAERQARDFMAAADAHASLIAYQQCLAQRRVDCDTYGGLYPPAYAAPVLVVPARHRRPPPERSSSLTGLTAGNVVRPGIIPGNFNGPGAITAGNLVTFGPNAVVRGARRGASFTSR